MSWQTRLWIEGYDSRLVPRVPFEIRRPSADLDRVQFLHFPESGPKSMLVAPDERKGASPPASTGVALGSGTESPDEVLALVEAIPFRPGWLLFNRSFSANWPRGALVHSTPAEIAWPFELTLAGGKPDEMAYVQGPLDGKGPAPARLVADGMRIALQGTLAGADGPVDWFELEYFVAGEPWRQRRYWVYCDEGTFLVTAQAMLTNRETMFRMSDELAISLRKRLPE